MTVTDKQLAEWEALADMATPGPWDSEGSYYVYAQIPGGRPNGEYIARFSGGPRDCLSREMRNANAAFAAHARTAVPQLVAEVRRLREQVQSLAGDIDHLLGDQRKTVSPHRTETTDG